MSKGKYYSLEEARKADDLEGFAKAHPSKGDKAKFDSMLGRMLKTPPQSKKGRGKKNV